MLFSRASKLVYDEALLKQATLHLIDFFCSSIGNVTRAKRSAPTVCATARLGASTLHYLARAGPITFCLHLHIKLYMSDSICRVVKVIVMVDHVNRWEFQSIYRTVPQGSGLKYSERV